ncbi:MliC family protein [Rivibacter subsaxonicus]|uniref:Membrane-bound lysozyme inhibitor of c-type lysozyme MliC n=1 Tax=Rivibacter subsaxonicus TaxID=457575 RepID=A0A4Q7VW97_9BURK|nr:MliC family protein [Rivibacter subsaxonicus]RZU00930.1 uncharacterized protein EV670_1643 [Rivibacter subsaxonicus]
MKPHLARPSHPAWAAAVLMLGLLAAGAAGAAEGPSFDCAKVAAESMAALVCGDPGLAQLDRKLAQVYAQATKAAVDERPPMLKAEQRGWVKGRDDCWRSSDQRACVETSYRLRTVELQARYRLLPGVGPVRFVCNGDAANEVLATFFATEPPTLVAERGDATSLMVLQPSASGARYEGRNESLWEHQGQALIRWGYGATEMRCLRAGK